MGDCHRSGGCNGSWTCLVEHEPGDVVLARSISVPMTHSGIFKKTRSGSLVKFIFKKINLKQISPVHRQSWQPVHSTRQWIIFLKMIYCLVVYKHIIFSEAAVFPWISIHMENLNTYVAVSRSVFTEWARYWYWSCLSNWVIRLAKRLPVNHRLSLNTLTTYCLATGYSNTFFNLVRWAVNHEYEATNHVPRIHWSLCLPGRLISSRMLTNCYRLIPRLNIFDSIIVCLLSRSRHLGIQDLRSWLTFST